ncbi:MAG TPA: protein kinase, partial [Myxococcus sp.]|nr:protein kinase [Myxococcus sp.]
MSTPPFHPDQLGPGSAVGHWLILETLGAGGFGRVFKVEREGQPGRHYALKMALRPQGPHAPDEEDLEGRLSHEVAAQLAYLTDLQVHAMDRWPTPQGYLFFVTDYIDGEPFHQWRWRVKPSAEHLLKVFMEVVRRVAELHKRGLLHRDLKSDNILIRT